MTLLDLVKSIPDVIWSGIVASVLTLGGVLIANASNTKRLKIQLKHDSTEKLRDRQATLRRDVYLNAAEELVKASSYLGALPSVNVATTNIGSGLQGFFVAASKLALVSDPSTAYEVNELVGQYGELFLKLTVKLLPLQSVKTDIGIRDDHYERCRWSVRAGSGPARTPGAGHS